MISVNILPRSGVAKRARRWIGWIIAHQQPLEYRGNRWPPMSLIRNRAVVVVGVGMGEAELGGVLKKSPSKIRLPFIGGPAGFAGR